MKTTVDIAGVEMIVEYEFKITAHGSPESWSSYGGDPAEPAEFEIEVLGLSFPILALDISPPDIPSWLNELLNTHLAEREDINDIIQSADLEPSA